MGKKKGSSTARVSMMLKDLRQMKAILLPDEPDVVDEQEMKDMDDFQKTKAKLTKLLHAIEKSVEEYQMEKKKRGERDRTLIAMQNKNDKDLRTAAELLIALKNEYDKNAKKKKLEPNVLAARAKWLELFAKELERLRTMNSHHGPAKPTALDSSIDANAKQRAQRAERRRKRRARRRATGGDDDDENGTGGGGDDEDNAGDENGDDEDRQPASAQEQAFMDEKVKNDKKMDELLDVINRGLGELKEIAIDINTNIKVTSEMLEEVDKKMDGTIENFQSANKRLKRLIDENTGGATSWCPVIICIVILLGVAGYIFNITI